MRNNHVRALLSLSQLYRIVAVADPERERRDEASRIIGARTTECLAGLLESEADLVVVATPSHLHATQAIEALEAGEAVVCEKPMALDLAEADAVLATAARTGSLLTVFHNYRFESDFLKTGSIVRAGVLGELLMVRLTVHRFGRRRDWQALSRLGGGAARNTGTHLVDQGLALAATADAYPTVLGHVARANSPGEAEDHLKVLMHCPAGPMVDVEVTDTCAFPSTGWPVIGTRGSLAGDPDALSWRFVDGDDLTPLGVDGGPAEARSYRFAAFPHREDRWQRPDDLRSSAVLFYQRLYETIREGASLAVTPESARRVVWVIDQCLKTRPPADA